MVHVGTMRVQDQADILPASNEIAIARVSEALEAATTDQLVVVTVLHNGVLGYQRDAEDVKFGRHTAAVRFTPVDHAAIARACGCRGVAVTHADEYLPALREALASGEPTLIDVDTDPEAYPPITLFDDKLEAVFSKKKVTMFEMNKHLSRHLS